MYICETFIKIYIVDKELTGVMESTIVIC